MAKKQTGKWVARAAATGGSRSYRGQRPVKWYSSLALICVLGVALVWYSRYERLHPSSAGQPAIGTSWYSAFAVDICGTVEPNLPSNPGVKGAGPGLTTAGDGVIHIAPHTASEAGANATLGRFASDYRGMVLTSTQLRYPGRRSAGVTVDRTFSLGERCPKGTKYAGRKGQVEVDLWTTPTATKPVVVSDPPALRLGDEQELTIAFLPKGVAVPRPPGTAVTAMLQDASAQGSSGSTPPTSSTPTSSTPTSSTPTSSTPTSSTPTSSTPTSSTPTSSTPAGSGTAGASAGVRSSGATTGSAGSAGAGAGSAGARAGSSSG